MNVEDLRDMLAGQMLLLKRGKSDPKLVNAMVNAAGKVLASVRLELDYAKMIGAQPCSSFIKTKPIPPAPIKDRSQRGRVIALPKRAA